MRNAEPHTRRAGFTVLEVIVVMGIIAILAAVMMPLLRGTSDSALATQCKNNMKNLATGAISWAQANKYGHFPPAGYYRTIEIDVWNKSEMYPHHDGWIFNKGTYSALKNKYSKECGTPPNFTDTDKECREVIERGSLWKAVGESFEVYRCPVHARAFKKKNKRLPGWSYMMNKEFGYGSKVTKFLGQGLHGLIKIERDGDERDERDGRAHDKVLMFAEVQGVDVSYKAGSASISLKAVKSGIETDPILEYDKERIGFNHNLGKQGYGGNVAFADGHVDTVLVPKSMKYKELTKDLCTGVDVPHDGSYEP